MERLRQSLNLSIHPTEPPTVGACRRHALPWPVGVTFMSSRTGGWFPFGGLDVDPGGYGGRDGLPFRGAPTALESWVLVLTVGRGWRAGGAPGLGPLRFRNGSVGPADPALHSSLCTLHSALVFSPQAVVHQPGFDGRGAASAATTGKRELLKFKITIISL